MENYFNDKICLVTGGGGSIGSEIVRVLTRLGAKKVIAADISENGLYNLLADTPDVTAEVVSICDVAGMENIISKHRPDIVFHAAAHKHVPFMEKCPEQAVKNNIQGTITTVMAAQKARVKKFILISTDKAVEPISAMGASKRVCEFVLHQKSQHSVTLLSTVRFGNVIGSSGSVIPLFEKQIEKGMVTVTDREVTRYFMSIPCAAKLITDAARIMRGNEIFIPDMGERVKILDLAEKMIREAGKEPYKDVQVKFTGLRRGDKLHEKLHYDFEELRPSGIEGMYVTDSSIVPMYEERLSELLSAAWEGNSERTYNLLLSLWRNE